MKMKTLYQNLLHFLVLVFFGLNLNAQTGPGGVGNNAGISGQPTNKIWFDASMLSLSNNSPVNTWTDRSGNNNDGIQTVSTRRPEFRTGQINGLPAVIFDPTGGAGNEDCIPFDGSVIANSDYTVIFAAQRRSSDGRQAVLGGTNSGANNNLHIYWQNNTNFRAHHWGNDLSTPMVSNTETYSDGNDANEYGIFTTRLGSTEGNPQRKNYQNNHYLGGLNNNAKLNSWNGAAIGRFLNEYTDIDVAEVIIYSSALNAAQLQIVHNYLSEKYNITIDNDKYSPIASYSHDVAGIGMESGEKHSRAASAGFYVYENNGSLANNEYVFFSHSNTTNSAVTTDLPAGVEERWARDWYLDKVNTSDVDIKIVFDLPEGISGGKYPGTISNYTLLYRNSTSGNYSEVTTATAVSLGDADQIEFTLANSEYSDGYFTLGTKDKTVSPVTGVPGRTWYALVSGDWDNWETWTLDPAGMISDNPGHDVPANIDKVVIHTGKKVTVQPVSGTIIIAGITVEGKLDLQNTAVHNFTKINGSGKIMLSADNFPNGDASNFYTKGQGEGTVLYYGTGYTLSADREFFNVEIVQTNNTDVLIQTSDYTINGDFTVKKGIWQINDATDDAIRNLTVKGDVLVESTGQITVGTGNTFASDGYQINSGAPGNMPEDDGKDYHSIFHQFTVYGNFTNNGTVKLTNLTAPVYDQFATNGAVTLRFKGAENKTMSLNGTTNLYNLIIDRGSDQTYIQTITSSNIANFVLFGANSVGRTTAGGYTSENPQVRKALWIYNGTLKLIGAINIPTLSEGNYDGGNGDYTIGKNACLWIAGSGVTVYSTASDASQVPAGAGGVNINSSHQALSVYGKFRISNGFFGTRNSAGLIFWSASNARVHIEGGVVDVAQMRSASGGSGIASYVQTAGLLRARGNETEPGEYNGNYPLFGLEGTNSVFQMSGGEILLRDEDGDSDPEFSLECAEGNYLVTGGKLTIDVRDTRSVQVYSTANLWDVEIKNHTGSGNMTVELSNNLKVSHDLTLNNHTVLDVEDPDNPGVYYDVSIGKDFRIIEGATYTYGQNTTTFNGTENGELYIGHSTSDDYKQHFYNFTVNKPAGKSITLTGDLQKTATYIQANHPSHQGWPVLVDIDNSLTIEKGILSQGDHAIRLYGDINVKAEGQCGIYEYGVTNPYALVMLKDQDYTINSEDGAVFGNMKIGATTHTITLTSDVYMKRLSFYHGNFDLKTYNLKIDYLLDELSSNNFDIDDGGITGNTGAFYTSGNASDGGLSILVTKNDTYGFPLAVAGKYTPAEVVVTNYNSNGYITINPADKILQTTNLSGGDILSYYWRVGYSDFTTNPTVQLNFTYDITDDDSGNDHTFYPGKVLDEDPFTRSYINDLTKVDDDSEGGTHIISFDPVTLEKANYTAGVANRFTGTVAVFHSNSSYVSWNTASAWLENQVPTAGSIVYIRNGDRMSGPTTDVGYQTPAETILSGTDARVQYYNSGTYDLGIVKGYGIISFKFPQNATVNGDFADFASDSRSKYLYFASNTATYTLNNIPQPAPSVSLETANWIIDQNNLVLNYNFNCGWKHSNVTINKSMLVKGNLNISDYDRGDLRFPGSGSPVTVTVKGNVNVGDNIVVADPGSAADIEHKLIVGGNINVKEDNIDLFNTADRPRVILEIDGETNNYYTNTAGTVPDLYRVVMNKGNDQNYSFSFNDNFILNGATSGAGVKKALEMQNGTLILDDSAIDIDLTSGDDDFLIPETSTLEVRQGKVNAYGDDTGIKLNGKLLVSGGTVDMASGTGNGNNYITYGATGSATIEVTGGILQVGSQIRRQINTEEGVLTFIQSGGDVEIGVNAAPENSRGVFEILNAGSSFTHSGGNFTIVRQQTNPSIASFYFDPETANLNSGTVITIGNTNTPAGQNITAYINKPIKNLTLNNASSHNPKLTLQYVDVEIQENLTVSSGTEFDANGKQLTMSGGNFINNGTYTHNNNLVLFNGTGSQEISGTSVTSLKKKKKQAAGTLTLQNDIVAEDDMTVDAGIVADNSNDIYLYGDMYNIAELTHGSSGNGLSFVGNRIQKIYGNGGIYGKISINNPNGVELDAGTDNIFVNDAVQLEAGVFDIGENLLTMRVNAEFIPQNPFSSTNMVQINNSIGDSGVKKYFSSGTGTYFCPIGAAGKYTPVKITYTNNSSTTGNLTIKAVDEVHPTIIEDAEAPDTEITDVDNALQFYWTLIAHNFTDLTGTIEMFYNPGDVAVTATYTDADYITARLLSDGSGNWNHYDWADFDETAGKLIFNFNTPVADASISGDYTAGAEPNSANRLGAIPNHVPGYISIKDGDWTDVSTWDTYPTPGGTVPVGGPHGAMVIIDAPGGVPHTVVMDQNYISSYSTEIRGILQQKLTFGNKLGIIKGQGTLSTEHGSLPAGYYTEFLSETGGTLEYTGTDNYDILSQITELNNLVLSGSGERLFPNLAVQILGTLTLEGTVQAKNDNNRRISVKKDVIYNGGTFDAGTGAGSVFEFNGTAAQAITGTSSFTGTNAFWNVEINNSAGITLLNPVDIDNELIFNAGVIHTTATNILTLESSLETIVSGAGKGKYVDGPLNKNITVGGDFSFPVGNNGRYGYAGLNDVSKTDIWQVEYYNNNPTDDGFDISIFVAPLQQISDNEYWRIKAPASETAKVILRWDALNGGFADDAHRSDMRIAEWRDEATDAWYEVDAVNTISGNSTAGTISSNVNSTFNEFTSNPFGNIFTLSTVYSIIDFTWDGSESTVWENVLNWSGNEVPSAMDNAIIPDGTPHDPTINSAATCNKLTIAANTTVTISAGKSLTVNGDFSNSGILLLKSPASNAASASFIDNGTITGTGKIQVERYMEANKFHYVSIPIQSGGSGNATSNLFTTSHPSGYFNPNFYTYNEAMDLDGNPSTAPSGAFDSDNLVPGWTFAHNNDNGAVPVQLDEKTGYAFYSDANQTITFTGIPNTGDISITGLSYTGNDPTSGPLPDYYDGWNLVSNPYPSSIDWDMIKSTRSDLDDGIYVWDGTQYASYANSVKGGSMNLSNEIAPMQAFFVHATANNASFELNNGFRVHSSVNYLKGNDKEENLKPNFIRLKMEANGLSDYTVIYFTSNATENFDGSFDAFKLFSPSYMPQVPHIYSVIQSDKTPLSINVLPENTMDNLIIPLYIKIGQAGTYTISSDEFNFENNHVYFVDKQENTEIYLNEENLSDYSFTCGSGVISDRFELRFFKNNAPIVQNEIPAQSVFEDNQFEFAIPQNAFVENDLNDEIVSFTATTANGENLPAWLNFDSETLKFSGQASNDDVGIIEIKVKVADKMGATASQIFSITVVNTNDAPILENEIPDMETNISELYTYTIPENTFTDVDLGDKLTYSANLEDGNQLPEWLYFNSETNTFSGIPAISEVLNIKVTASDILGAEASDIFKLTINGTSNISNANDFEFRIYPNPAEDYVNIISAYDNFKGLNMKITDVSGKLILIKNITSNKTEINISKLNQGIYFVEIMNDSEIFRTKFIKQ